MNFTMNTENEAIALTNYFIECGVTAKRKGNSVKATGDSALISYLYNKFVMTALI